MGRCPEPECVKIQYHHARIEIAAFNNTQTLEIISALVHGPAAFRIVRGNGESGPQILIEKIEDIALYDNISIQIDDSVHIGKHFMQLQTPEGGCAVFRQAVAREKGENIFRISGAS